jgi:UDP-3-O-[3-hydroxymyristoyl] glucosamine N-acyltransferase
MVILFQVFYFIVARYFPSPSLYSLLSRLSKKCRAIACKQFFHSTRHNVNTEHSANFGSGHIIEIGDNSDIGMNCHVSANARIGFDERMWLDLFIT